MADGSTIRCRLQDADDMISVYVDSDYGRLRVPWAELRSIVDIGATTGSFTLWASQRSPEAQIIAVEPNPEVYPYLLANIRANQLSGRVTCVAAALGPAAGVASIQAQGAYTTQTRFAPHDGGPGQTVRQLSLEQLLDETKTLHSDLLKVDCEGCEYDVLLGASRQLLGRFSNIVCEYHPIQQTPPSPQGEREDIDHRDRAQLVAHLTASGFQVEADRSPVGFIVAHASD
jgi:FkbM family methyltransferase